MSGIYVDSSAVLKRVFIEADGDVVERTLRTRVRSGEVVGTSTLTWVEVTRSIMRSGSGDVDNLVETALSGVAELPLRDGVLGRARRIGPADLRSLDAIHLASAVELGATELLTFDARLAAAAALLGMNAIP